MRRTPFGRDQKWKITFSLARNFVYFIVRRLLLLLLPVETVTKHKKKEKKNPKEFLSVAQPSRPRSLFTHFGPPLL